jgi:2-keto-4-pentenoate hydratase/2-oxohepta-3-ene-1,7-dioic acid hydratase in catechol pathway
MKLVLYNDYRLGVIRDDKVVDATEVVDRAQFRRPQDMLEEVIINWDDLKPRLESAAESNEGIPLQDVRLRAPVPRPSKLICAAVNYLEFGQREPAILDAFLKSPSGIIGNGDTCELPPTPATVFHHEAELALVIGKKATKVTEEDALSYVFGYTHFLDMSALVTADEIPSPNNLQVRLWNNGEPRHDFSTSDMAHQIPELISEFSKITTLEPGDIIATGVNHQQIGAVQDGDVLRMEIENLGPSLVVHISDPSMREWPRGIDTEMAARIIAMAPIGR